MKKRKTATKKTVQPRRIGDAAPLMIRGTRIYVLEVIDSRDLESAGVPSNTQQAIQFAKELQRGEVMLSGRIIVRQGRRGRWVYQIADGIWTEVRFLEDIPWEAG